MKFLNLTLIVVCFGLQVQARPSDETQRRTSPSHDIFRRFHQHFPYAGKVSEGCTMLTTQNQTFLGENSPIDGKPTFKEVSPAFLNWYYGCINEYFSSQEDRGEFLRAGIEFYLGSFAGQYLQKLRLSPDYFEDFKNKPFWDLVKIVKWAALPENVQTSIIKNILDTFIGPEIILDETSFMKEQLAGVIPSDATISVAILNLIVSTMTQEEFLNF